MYIDDIAANYCRTVQCGMMVIFFKLIVQPRYEMDILLNQF